MDEQLMCDWTFSNLKVHLWWITSISM